MFIFVNVTVVLKYSHRGEKQKKQCFIFECCTILKSFPERFIFQHLSFQTR